MVATSQAGSNGSGTGIVDTRLHEPKYLHEEEQRRREQYIIRGMYYNPGKDGLYRSQMSDSSYLRNLKTWTNETGIAWPYYPYEMWGAYCPVRNVVDTDSSALMNEFTLDSIQVDDEEMLTNWVHDVLRENNFMMSVRRAFKLSGVHADSYYRVDQDETKQNKIALRLYPADQIFPLLSSRDVMKADSFRIYSKKNEAVSNPDRPHVYNTVQVREHYELIKPEGFQYYVDDQLEEEGDYPNVIPIVHFFHSQVDDYFGIPVCDSHILESIDRINFMFTALWMRSKRLLHDQILTKGWDGTSSVMLGQTYVYPLPDPNMSMEVVQFPMPAGYIEFLKLAIDTLKNQLPHFQVQGSQETRAGMSSDSVKARYGPYITYGREIQSTAQVNIETLVKTILVMGGKIKRPDEVKVNVNMGNVISEDVESKLNAMEKEQKLLGDGAPVKRRFMQELKVPQEDQDEILEHDKTAKEKAELAEAEKNKPQGNFLLDRLRAK